jgi:hypothetical protein
MLLTKEVEVKISKKNIEWFISKGYSCNLRDKIIINTTDLTIGSHVFVEVQCDYCGKQYSLKWQDYNKRDSVIKKDCCKDCWYIKCSESNQRIYGVTNQFQREETKEKIRESNINKYGVEHPMQNEEYKNKVKQSNLDKYGYDNVSKFPDFINKIRKTQIEKYGSMYSQTDDYKDKYKKTCQEKYGVDNVFQMAEVKEKIIQFNLNTYGVDHPMKLDSIKRDRMDKMLLTQIKNGSFQSSRQQNYLHSLLGGNINYVVGRCLLDIAFLDDNFYIEYDGSGHDLSVQFGDLTKEEFDRKELSRKYFLKNLGWKEIRIISKEDFLPSDAILLEMFDIAKDYLKSNHNWIKFDIDNNKIITSQFENDINYGRLRKITEKDLKTP